MVLDTIKQLTSQLPLINGSNTSLPNPFDPLSPIEIEKAVSIIRTEKADLALHFNTVTLHEPRKAGMLAWLAAPTTAPRPPRVADIVAIAKGSKVYDGLVDLDAGEITKWKLMTGVQPLITMEDLLIVESVVKKDPKIIEQCGIIGIPEEDMHKVYCDPWTIGFDERWGSTVRLQQALMYYRSDVDDSQYTYPLDFCPIYNADTQEVIDIDIPKIRRPLSKAAPSNFHAKAIEAEKGGFMTGLKTIEIRQPEGVSFKIEGRTVEWAKWKFHIGFNHREGIVLNDISFLDGEERRSLFYRISLAEMVVPYGNGEAPHHRKHAFDIGEYGMGLMTNSLSIGCDCKGSIHYMDAHFVNRAGAADTIKNAICIHEEDNGILFKHTDFRDNSCTVTRARKLVVSQIFTAANYEYCVYWQFHLDGTIQLELKLTGILNTYACNPGEDLKGWGTQVYPGVNAHIEPLITYIIYQDHQHLFNLRLDPNLDSLPSTIVQVDTLPNAEPVGHPTNPYGNAFTTQRTPYTTVASSVSDYDSATSRTWDITTPSRLNLHSGKPGAYKLVSREVPPLLPKEGSLVWKRAGFARHAVHVTQYADDQLHPAGRHVPQTSGEPNAENADLMAWIAEEPGRSIEEEDVVVWHTFGLTHIPAPEDWPIMAAEPVSVLLRPRNFFARNPALDVPPSFSSWPSQMRSGGDAYGHANGEGSRVV